MTDFIMEQEQPTVVAESYTDADLVSDYMSLCAASANMACIYECATIVEFCQANDIAVPEMLVQEGFSEVMSNIWKGIAKFFETIAEWFRGLVQKTSSVVAKAKLQETIAKLKQRKGEELPGDLISKASYLRATYNILIDGLAAFRENVLHELTENATEKAEDNKYKAWLGTLVDLTEDYNVLADSKKFLTASNEFKPYTPKSKALADLVNGYNTLGEALAKLSTDEEKAAEIGKSGLEFIQTTDDLIKLLEKINSADIPATGTKLLKAIDADTKQFKALVEQTTGSVKKTVVANVSDANTEISEAEAKKIKSDAALNDEVEVPIKEKVWANSPETTKKVKDCADALAKAYDSVSKVIIDISVKEYKDLEVTKADKKQYEKDLAAANKDNKRYDFNKNSNLEKG